jgi:hypothetical protein
MVELYGAKYVSLHVRETNYAAFHLYRDTLKFAVHGTEAKYYADGENAYDMRKVITREMLGLPPLPERAQKAAPPAGAAAGGAGAAAGGAGKRGRAPHALADLGGALGAGESVAAAAADAAVDAAGAAADIEPGARDVAAATAALRGAHISKPVVEELD